MQHSLDVIKGVKEDNMSEMIVKFQIGGLGGVKNTPNGRNREIKRKIGWMKGRKVTISI